MCSRPSFARGCIKQVNRIVSNSDSAARSVMAVRLSIRTQKTDDDERRASATLARANYVSLEQREATGRGLRSSDTHSTQHDQRVKSFAIDRPRG